MSREFIYRKAVEAEALASAGMMHVVAIYVDRAADGARRLGPIPRTHHYERSIGGVVGRSDRRVIGRVFSTDIAAHIIEFGSINNPPYAPLRLGVESTGLRVTDPGKPGGRRAAT